MRKQKGVHQPMTMTLYGSVLNKYGTNIDLCSGTQVQWEAADGAGVV